MLLLIARPLLFSLDPAVARVREVPMRLLDPRVLALVGVTAAKASQAVGALLLFGLLAVTAMWVGIALAHAPKLPRPEHSPAPHPQTQEDQPG